MIFDIFFPLQELGQVPALVGAAGLSGKVCDIDDWGVTGHFSTSRDTNTARLGAFATNTFSVFTGKKKFQMLQSLGTNQSLYL